MLETILRAASLCSLCSLLFFSGACTKAAVDLQAMKSLDGFSLNQNVKILSSLTANIPVSGFCDSKFSDIDLSLDQGTTWNSLRLYDTSSHINCDSAGTFSAGISPTGLPGVMAVLKTSTTGVHLLFRGRSSFGLSPVSDLLVSMQVQNMGTNSLVAGTHSTTAISGVNLTGHLIGSSTSFSSGTYRLTGRLTPRY